MDCATGGGEEAGDFFTELADSANPPHALSHAPAVVISALLSGISPRRGRLWTAQERSGAGRSDPQLCDTALTRRPRRLPLLCCSLAAVAAREAMGGDRSSSRGRRSRRSHSALRRLQRSSEGGCSSRRPLPLRRPPFLPSARPLPAAPAAVAVWWERRVAERDEQRQQRLEHTSRSSRCPRQAMGCTERSRGVGPFERAGAALSEHFLSLPQLCVLCLCSSMLQLDRHPLARHRFAPVVSAS